LEVDVSCYDLSRLLFDLKLDESVYRSSVENFEQVMSKYDLTAEEKDALRAGDPRKLRQLGVHGMLCLYIKRLQPEFRDNIYWQQK
jgi:Aromatic-ring-opening dioxygenase LigAB, LigA subunit